MVPFAPYGAAVRDARTGLILAVGTWGGARYDWTTGPRWKRPDLEPDERADLPETLRLVVPEVLYVEVRGLPTARDKSGGQAPNVGRLYLSSTLRDNAVCIMWSREPPVYQPPLLDQVVREDGEVVALLPQAYELEYHSPGVELELGTYHPVEDRVEGHVEGHRVLELGGRLGAALGD